MFNCDKVTGGLFAAFSPENRLDSTSRADGKPQQGDTAENAVQEEICSWKLEQTTDLRFGDPGSTKHTQKMPTKLKTYRVD